MAFVDFLEQLWETTVRYPGRWIMRMSGWYVRKSATRKWWMP